MKTTTVVNCKVDPYDVYIGRGSPWGNPFRINSHTTRPQAIDKHQQWLWAWLKKGNEIRINGVNNRWVIEHISELRGKILGCYCAPLDCHGDILAELADTM